MKRIGIIGGVSPESTIIYYRLLNQAAQRVYGGKTSAEIVIHALNFGEMYSYYSTDRWSEFKARVVAAAQDLVRSGCDLIGISSNTTQVAARDVAAAIDVPVINMLDCLCTEMNAQQIRRPLLLGTPFVMNGDYYRPELSQRYGFECLVPDPAGQAEVDRVIFEELVNGIVSPQSRDAYLHIIEQGRASGADGVILGCTEIGMLIDQAHTAMPVFDTTRIHAAALAEAAFASDYQTA